MNDVSKLNGAYPVGPQTDRVLKPPRKRRSGERSPGKGYHKNSNRKDDDGGLETPQLDGLRSSESEENVDPGQGGELLIYGSKVKKTPPGHKVNLVI